jgi:hypothetical protein
MHGNIVFLIPIVSIIALFTFLAIATWASARRRERESYYRHETLKKLADQPGDSAEKILSILHEEADLAMQRRRDAQRIGGLVTLAVGVGLTILIRVAEPNDPVFVVGFIPLLVGLVLAAYGFFAPPVLRRR